MTQTTKSISPLRQRMLDDMRMRKLSDKTQSHYIRAVVNLTRFLDRSPDTATPEDLRRYQLHLVETGTSRRMPELVTVETVAERWVLIVDLHVDEPPGGGILTARRAEFHQQLFVRKRHARELFEPRP